MRQVKIFIAWAFVLATLIGVGYLGYLIGRAQFHREIIEDMRRYNEPAIMARTPGGELYLITSSDKITGFYRNRLQSATKDID